MRVFALLLAIFCAWQLAGLPGALIRKYEPPFDMPWFGFGVKQVAVDAEGMWHIARQGYADRAAYYMIKPGAKPRKYFTVPVELQQLDRSGNMNLQPAGFADGVLSIKSSRQYWVWRWRLKNLPATARERAAAYQSDGSEDLVGPHLPAEPNVAVFYSDSERHEFRVLSGHQHYRVFDGVAAFEPNVWLTTDRGRNIHRLVLRSDNGAPWFEHVESKPTILKARLEHNASLGFLAEHDRLFMLLPGGRVDYYDPLTLEFIESEQLPGEWREEYASLLYTGRTYSFYQGQPLAEPAYNRVMRGLMLLFLLSLVILAVSWSTACTSISDRTTGDTTPS